MGVFSSELEQLHEVLLSSIPSPLIGSPCLPTQKSHILQDGKQNLPVPRLLKKRLISASLAISLVCAGRTYSTGRASVWWSHALCLRILVTPSFQLLNPVSICIMQTKRTQALANAVSGCLDCRTFFCCLTGQARRLVVDWRGCSSWWGKPFTISSTY